MTQEGVTILDVAEHDTTMSGNPVKYLSVAEGQIVSHLVEVAPGGQTSVHKHPAACYMYVLDGVLTVELSDGTRRQYEAGESFLEDPDSWVNNLNTGTEPAKFLAVIPSGAGLAPIEFQ